MNNSQIQIRLIISLIVFSFLGACSQDEGIGGKSTIKGRLVEQVYNDDFTILLDEQAYMDEDVYLMFGDDNIVGEHTSTSNTGEFEFEYLWDGDYRIVYYVPNLENDELQDSAVVVEIALGKGKTKDLGDLIVKKTLKWDEGSSTISGLLVEQVYNDDYSVLLHEYPCVDEDVYLVYGDNDVIIENTSSSNTGEFSFEKLLEGEYKVIYYEQNDINPELQDEAVVTEVTLGKSNAKNVGDLIVKKTLDWDEGTAKIRGKIMLTNYRNESVYPDNMLIKDVSPAQEENVYITYGEHEIYDNKLDTNHDGTFVFENLIKGKYTIYVYSEDLSGATQKVVISQIKVVENDDDDIDLGIINIYQL